MVTVTNRQTIYEMARKGAILVISRYTRDNRSIIASLVVPERKTIVDVDPMVAKKAIDSGMMARMSERKENGRLGYKDRGLVDDKCEYWVMAQ